MRIHKTLTPLILTSSGAVGFTAVLALLGAFDRPELASYDIEFFTETSEDSEFAEALAEAGNVILARKMAYRGNRWTLPAPVLRRSARSLVDMPYDTDRFHGG